MKIIPAKFKNPFLPQIRISLILKDEIIRLPKHISLPFNASFRDLKFCISKLFKMFWDLDPLKHIRFWLVH